MNIVIDIGHPAHVHLYRHFIKEMAENGHRIWVTVKNVAASKKLLEIFRIPFIEIGNKSDSLLGKALCQFKYNGILRKLVNNHDIAVGMGTSITIAHVSRLSRMKSVVFDDDDDRVEPLFAHFAHPFIDYLLSPDVLQGRRRKKATLYYPGYHELAYLHPRRFSPDPHVIEEIGVKPGESFFLLRFNAFKAHHDIGVSGLGIEEKRRLVRALSKKGKVFITMERDLEPEFEGFRLKVSPEKVHSLLYHATMFIGDSQTMTSEAAVLGTPAIRSNSFVGRISYLEEEEHRYGLTFGFRPDQKDAMFAKIDELLAMKDLKEEWQRRRDKMLADKIDVTAFMVWFIENLPESATIMREQPEFQYNFK